MKIELYEDWLCVNAQGPCGFSARVGTNDPSRIKLWLGDSSWVPVEDAWRITQCMKLAIRYARHFRDHGFPRKHEPLPDYFALGIPVEDLRPFRRLDLAAASRTKVHASGYEFEVASNLAGGLWIIPSEEADEWIEECATWGDVSPDLQGRLTLRVACAPCSCGALVPLSKATTVEQRPAGLHSPPEYDIVCPDCTTQAKEG